MDGVSVTVIVPCFEATGTLRACVASLLVQETVRPYEIIVVENGSRDGTPALARELAAESLGRMRVVEEPVPGSYAARNRGVAEARGEVLLFTDADCEASAGWVEGLASALDDPSVLLAGGPVLAGGSGKSIVARYADRQQILSQTDTLQHPRGPFFQTANLGARRAEVQSVKGFDPGLYSGGDADLCWRLQRAHPGRTLRFSREASVRHTHRETLRGLLRQFRRYGEGDVLLTRKHGRLPVFTLLKGGADVLRIAAAPLLGIGVLPFALWTKDPVLAASPWLRALRALARRWGQGVALLQPKRLHRA